MHRTTLQRKIKKLGIEAFLLIDGGIYTALFWFGWVLLGSLVPMGIVYHPALGKSRGAIAGACVLVILGGLAAMYVIIIGGQAFPLDMFPGKEVSSSFFDGVVVAEAETVPVEPTAAAPAIMNMSSGPSIRQTTSYSPKAKNMWCSLPPSASTTRRPASTCRSTPP